MTRLILATLMLLAMTIAQQADTGLVERAMKIHRDVP